METTEAVVWPRTRFRMDAICSAENGAASKKSSLSLREIFVPKKLADVRTIFAVTGLLGLQPSALLLWVEQVQM